MKRLLLTLLLSALAVTASAQSAGIEPEAPRAGMQEGDRYPTFRSISHKESIQLFREWFRDAYLCQYRLYKKRNKATYKYQKREFQSVVVRFCIDTLGRPQLMETRPASLSGIQTEVLQATFDEAPSWTPAVQKGRKVKVEYTMPVNE